MGDKIGQRLQRVKVNAAHLATLGVGLGVWAMALGWLGKGRSVEETGLR